MPDSIHKERRRVMRPSDGPKVGRVLCRQEAGDDKSSWKRAMRLVGARNWGQKHTLATSVGLIIVGIETASLNPPVMLELQERERRFPAKAI
jgi:hypothetical protein